MHSYLVPPCPGSVPLPLRSATLLHSLRTCASAASGLFLSVLAHPIAHNYDRPVLFSSSPSPFAQSVSQINLKRDHDHWSRHHYPQDHDRTEFTYCTCTPDAYTPSLLLVP